MTKRHRYFLAIISLLIFSCSQEATREGDVINEVTVGILEGPSKISVIGMIEGIAPEGGVNIKFIIKSAPDLIISEMVKGNLDFAVLPTTTAALLYNRGVDYRLLGIPLWGTLSITGTGHDIDSFPDLYGKRIYVMGRGMTPDIILRYLLSFHNLVPGRDVVLDYSFPAPVELANAMRAGVIDLGIVSEPHTSYIIHDRPAIRRLIDLTVEWEKMNGPDVPLAQTAFLVKADFGAENPEIVRTIQARYKESINFINSEPEKAVKLLMENEFFDDRQVAEHCLQQLHLDYKEGFIFRENINRFLRVFLSMNDQIIGGRIPDEKFYYTQ